MTRTKASLFALIKIMAIYFVVRDSHFRPIYERLNRIMSQLDDLQAALDGLSQSVQTAAARVSQDLTSLQGEVKTLEQQQGVDLSGVTAAAENIKAQVDAIDQAAGSQIPVTPVDPSGGGTAA